MDCPVCGTEDSLTYYKKDGWKDSGSIICIAYEADGNDTSCGAVFDLDRDTVRKSWMKKLVKSSCKGDSEFPCQEIQCPSCEALEDEELIFNADDRDQHPDVDRSLDLDKA